MTVEELDKVNNEYAVAFIEYFYNYIASQADSLSVTEQGPMDIYVTLTDGKWLIKE